MKQVLWAVSVTGVTNTTVYTGLMGRTAAWTVVEANVRVPWPAAGVFRNLIVEVDTAPGVGNTHTFTLRKNGASTALAVTISGTATTARITGTDLSVAVADFVGVQHTGTGSPGSSNVRWSLEFEGATLNESAYAFALAAQGSGSTRYTGVFVAESGSFPTAVPAVGNVVGADGTVTRLVAGVSAATSAGNGFTYYLNKNGVRQDGTGGTVNTACALTTGATSATSTFSLPITGGDLLYTEAVSSGSFSVRTWSIGAAFVATTTDQFQVCGDTIGNWASTTLYGAVAASATGNAIETTFIQRMIGGVQSVRLSGFRVRLATAPGSGKSRTIDLRRNAASPGPTLTISDLATTGSDSSNTALIADGDVWNLRTVPTATPAASVASWGCIGAVLIVLPPLETVPGAYAITGAVGGLVRSGAALQFRLLIDGIDRTAWLANGYGIDIEKVLSSETMHMAILDLDSTMDAYRPMVGESIRFTRLDDTSADIELLFAGVIAQVVDEPIIDDTGTVTRLRCRDLMYLADQVFLPTRSFASATARAMFTEIVETYLGPKDVIVISAPTGGPVAPELRLEDPVTPVREALDRLTLNVGFPWRIAEPTTGTYPFERWAAIVEPGELAGPATLADDGASVLTDPPLTWEKEMLTHATRVWVQTATSETNSGPVEFTEDWTSDGATSVYPVHVIPSAIRASTTAAAESLDTTLALDGLPPTAMIRIGGRLTIDWHTQVYTVAATVTTDAEGKVTISVTPGVERDVPEGHAIEFKPGAFVQLEVNGVVTAMDGSPYVWDDEEHAIVYPGGSWTVGTVITYRTWVYHPVWIREWDASAQQAVGWFDYATLIDQQLTDEEGHTEIDPARAWAQAELGRRLQPPTRVTCTTRIPGHYPLLTVPLSFPDRLVVGDYLITETRIRMSTIDENSDEQPLFYELVLMQGDYLGESWIQYFRGRNPSAGIRWGKT